MIDNQIVTIKSVPDRYERDFTEAKKLLEISDSTEPLVLDN